MTTKTSPQSLYPKASAVLIRGILKKAFPETKFSVTIGRGAGVSSVRIHWSDGPTPARVDELVKCFQAGHFDGMIDMYEYNKGPDRYLIVDGVPYVRSTNYVFTERSISPELANRCITQIAAYWGGIAEPLPVAIAPKHGGDGLEIAEGRGRERVRADLQHYDSWYDLIHRAANDRTRFTPTCV